jgi:hypothetical protein
VLVQDGYDGIEAQDELDYLMRERRRIEPGASKTISWLLTSPT